MGNRAIAGNLLHEHILRKDIQKKERNVHSIIVEALPPTVLRLRFPRESKEKEKDMENEMNSEAKGNPDQKILQEPVCSEKVVNKVHV